VNAEANGRAACYAALAAVAFVAQQVTGRATRDALFLSVFDAVDIPRVMLGAAAFSLIAVALSARMMSRLGPAPSVPFFCGLSALLFGFEAMSLPDAPRVIAVLNYLHMTAIGAIVLSGFWSIVNERFDPHTAKKVVSRITAGAALGGLAGGGLAYALSEWAELRTGLFVLAAINLLCAFGASQPGRSGTPAFRDRKDDGVASNRGDSNGRGRSALAAPRHDRDRKRHSIRPEPFALSLEL